MISISSKGTSSWNPLVPVGTAATIKYKDGSYTGKLVAVEGIADEVAGCPVTAIKRGTNESVGRFLFAAIAARRTWNW